MATKAIPITKNAGKTVPAVSIGCQAGNFCWLKSLSGKWKKKMSNVFYIYVNLQVEIFRKVHKEIVQIFKIHKREDHKYGNSVKVSKKMRWFYETVFTDL